MYPLSPTLKALYPHDSDHRTTNTHKRTSTPAQPFILRDAAINRTDLIASAERIYSRYLMPGADKEVYLPSSLRLTEFPLSGSSLPISSDPDYEEQADAQARVPDMFHYQKEYVYRAMEQDTFPRFLRAKAFGNLTPVSSLIRLGFGLLCLWVGLATAFSFIFLDSKPKVKRLWTQSAPAAPTLSPEEVTLTTFARSAMNLLTFWPALRICTTQGWGNSSSLSHVAEDVVDLFYTAATSTSSQLPDQDEIEAVLLHVLSAEFSLTLEDNSEGLIARDLVALWKECVYRATNPPPHAEGLAEKFEKAADKARAEDGVGSYAAARQGGSDDDDVEDPSDLEDDSDSEDDSDEDMDGVESAPVASGSGRKKEEPVIDEDGFQMVPKKGRR
ncbi:pre-rRNA-processing protein TSR2, partial [Phenoliferia sp. Uapishka_3]